MSGQGIAQILVYVVVLLALRVSARRVHGLRVLASGSARRAGSPHPSAAFYRLLGTDARSEQDWKGYAKTALVFMVVFSAAALPAAAPPGPPAAEPGRH